MSSASTFLPLLMAFANDSFASICAVSIATKSRNPAPNVSELLSRRYVRKESIEATTQMMTHAHSAWVGCICFCVGSWVFYPERQHRCYLCVWCLLNLYLLLLCRTKTHANTMLRLDWIGWMYMCGIPN